MKRVCYVFWDLRNFEQFSEPISVKISVKRHFRDCPNVLSPLLMLLYSGHMLAMFESWIDARRPFARENKRVQNSAYGLLNPAPQHT
jgi:hypothetical protein